MSLEYKQRCSLLLFVATSSEERALEEAAKSRGTPFERIDRNCYWMGEIGNERVIAVRASGMGPLGRGGSADLALRFMRDTAASKIVQVGMAFGIGQPAQNYGDVVVSSFLVPYDNRDIKPDSKGGYVVDYARATWQEASESLVLLFQREQERGGRPFAIHIGAILSGAARIHTRIFRDELTNMVPAGDSPIVGGEMEGVGLLGAGDTPVWCVVKGIVDFADEDRDAVFERNRPIACRNAAEFVLSAFWNEATH